LDRLTHKVDRSFFRCGEPFGEPPAPSGVGEH
jgi:hypothetical protein